MTVLVTGGTGLVGSRLLNRWVKSGLHCRGLVRPGATLPAGVTGATGDVLSPESLPAAVKDVSAIVHLAAVFRTSDEALIWRVNVEGTNNLIAAIKEHAPGARLVMASTSNVYGPGLSHPGREDDEVQPTLAYPASKVAAEGLLRDSGLTWSTLRLPFVYGDADGHLEALPKQATAMGWHPARKLSVAHHEDISTAFRLALTGVTDGRIVNIADEAPLTIYEIAQILGEHYTSSRQPLTDPWTGHMDVTLARSLGFQAQVTSIYQAARDGRL